MTPSRSVVPASILAAVGLFGLSACGGEKPAGLAPFTPAASSTTASPSPTVASMWTWEQQQVIEGYDRYNAVITAILSKAEKIDMVKVRRVAKEPYATTALATISLIREGDVWKVAGFKRDEGACVSG